VVSRPHCSFAHRGTLFCVVTLVMWSICASLPTRALAQTPRTTANQGNSAHFGWNDPDGYADGQNSMSLLAIDNQTLAATSRVYNTLGDPMADMNLPAAGGNYTVKFKLIAVTPTVTPGNNSTVMAFLTTEYSINSGGSWTSVGGTSQVTASRSTAGVTTTAQEVTVILNFAGGGPVWIRLKLRGTANGTLPGGAVKVQTYISNDWATDPYAVTWSSNAPPGPTVTLPYSADLNGAADGVGYVHATPSVGSMGTPQSLSLVYNSAAVRPVALVFLDVTGPTSPSPSTYQLQVQLASNGANLTLMNGATSVYYTATPGFVDRLTAAIDAKANGLATGSYPVNLVLTSYYPGATQTTVIATRILVNDQTTSPFGAGVGLGGIGRLYTMSGSFGRLLVDGAGAMEYFDRTCSGCAFVSPAGESGTLVSYGDSVFRLTPLDGSFAEFNTQGYLVRHNVLPAIQDATFTWTNNLLTSLTDASGRGFSLTYSGGLLTQITDFASRATSTSIVSGHLVKVTDPDGGVDSLTYNSNNQLTQLNSRSGGVWNYGYNVLQQGDTARAPSATDYTGANVRPTTTVVPAAEVQWQPAIAGTSLGAPKGSIRPDTIYAASSDPLGHVTKIQVDRFGQATKVIDALGQVTTMTRDTLGQATSVREPTGHVTTATYAGYFLVASFDSSTGEALTFKYGRTTATQGLAAHYGWQDPDAFVDGTNHIALNATDDQTVAAGSRVYIKLGDPTAGANLPAADSNYTIEFKLIAATPTVTPGNNSTVTAFLSTEYSTNSGTSWTSVGGTYHIAASRSTAGFTQTVQVFTPTLHFAGGGPVWIRLMLRGTASGTISGGAVTVQTYVSNGWTTDPYPALWFKNGDTPPRLLGVRGGRVAVDLVYHDGTQGPAGTLKQEYVGNTLAPGTIGGFVATLHYPNGYGQDTLVFDGGGHKARWVYASAGSGGNLAQTSDALGYVTTFHYNAYGLVDSTTLPNAVKLGTAYDSLNRVTRTRNGLGYLTQYAYGATGLARVTDPKGQIYKFGLNAWGAVVTQHDLGDTTKVDSLKYDAGGQTRVAVTRRGDVINLTYDQLGRLRTRIGPDFPAESLSYGLLAAGGSWMVAASSNGRDSLAYDKAGRLVYAIQRLPGDTSTYAMSYTYDSTGHLINRTAPTLGSVARWVYRKDVGVLDTVCVVGACTAFTYDNELKPDTLTYLMSGGYAWPQAFIYDSLHHVTSMDTPGGLRSAWAYDSLGRASIQRRSLTFDYPREVYTYDGAGQLVNGCMVPASSNPCNNEYGQAGLNAYAFDSAGNRADTTAHAVIGSGNRTTQFKGYAITYDANGNVIKTAGLGTVGIWTNTDTTTLQWNALGQLTRVEKWPAGGGHTIVTLRYDAVGRRIGKRVGNTTAWFLYDGDQVMMDVDSATHTMKAEYGYRGDGVLHAIRTPSDTLVPIVTPTIGTVLGLETARGGNVVKGYPDQVDLNATPLLPWGQEPWDTSAFVMRYRMGGQEYDQETGLYHMGARYYDPRLGRWLSEDPIGIAGGTNLYAYVGNDPVNGRDPTGLYSTCEWIDGNDFVCHAYPEDCDGQPLGQCVHNMAWQFCASIGGRWVDRSRTCMMPSGGAGAGPGGGVGTGLGSQQQANRCPALLRQLAPALDNLWHRSESGAARHEVGAWVYMGVNGPSLRQISRAGGVRTMNAGAPPPGAIALAHVHPNWPAPGFLRGIPRGSQDRAYGDHYNIPVIAVDRGRTFLYTPGHGTQSCGRVP
jgi:RHS repeat-associated protein